MSLGEACLDCIGCIWSPDVENELRRIIEEKETPMYVRANALFIFYGCEWDTMLNDREALQEAGLDDLLTWITMEPDEQEQDVKIQ